MLCCTNTDVHEFSRDLALFGLSGLKTKLNSIYTALNLSKTWLRPFGLTRAQHLLHGLRPSMTTPKGYKTGLSRTIPGVPGTRYYTIVV